MQEDKILADLIIEEFIRKDISIEVGFGAIHRIILELLADLFTEEDFLDYLEMMKIGFHQLKKENIRNEREF